MDITDEQIEALKQEAGTAEDLDMAAVAQRALGQQVTVPGDEARAALNMSKDEARAECARVIAETKTTED